MTRSSWPIALPACAGGYPCCPLFWPPRSAAPAAMAQSRLPAGPGMAQLEANQQRKVGQVYYADGNVQIRYRGTRLQADHAEYHADTDQAILSTATFNSITGRST